MLWCGEEGKGEEGRIDKRRNVTRRDVFFYIHTGCLRLIFFFLFEVPFKLFNRSAHRDLVIVRARDDRVYVPTFW